ncbi:MULTISPECIES: hypothetical protein [Roseomonadaceae]|uniref:DUF304 domain-containing protein n=1 Tax=Falsiroseomonas oleicola TaxID=2801474 RepID=A0ABS6H9Z2_9PROT|nr:hypothetical protein [Roseomonas oleicola]MBU8545196.1 hypothetical protein [Roseomonas oleicola]
MRDRLRAVTALYRNSRFRRVRGLQYGAWLAALAALAFALGALALPHIWPEGDALALAILAPILAAIALGLELYRSLYVTAIDAMAEGIRVETLAFWGRRPHLLPWISVTGQARAFVARGTVSTAITLRPPGARLPFLIDTTADAFDPAALRRLARRHQPRG